MRTVFCSSICMLTLLGCASSPPSPTAAADKARAERLINYSAETGEPINTAEGKKIVCKNESVANTRLKNRKVCLTEAEWLARADSAKEGVNDAARSGAIPPPK
jgi:hypothetical protein